MRDVRAPVRRVTAPCPRTPDHLARKTHDVAATADFCSRILGMAIAGTTIDDPVPSTGDAFPCFHIFFRMADGVRLACFECTDLPAPANTSSPPWSRHESWTQADLKAWIDAKREALRAGTKVSAAMVDLIRRNKQSRHPTET